MSLRRAVGKRLELAGIKPTGGSPSGRHYSRSTGDTTDIIVVSPDSTTSYIVIYSVCAGCRTAKDTSTVTANPIPTLTINGSDTICQDDSALLSP